MSCHSGQIKSSKMENTWERTKQVLLPLFNMAWNFFSGLHVPWVLGCHEASSALPQARCQSLQIVTWEDSGNFLPVIGTSWKTPIRICQATKNFDRVGSLESNRTPPISSVHRASGFEKSSLSRTLWPFLVAHMWIVHSSWRAWWEKKGIPHIC